MSDRIVTLSFENRDAADFSASLGQESGSSTQIRVEAKSAHLVAKWYGGYQGGDDYDVMIDGEIVEHDLNGEIAPLS